MLLFYHSGIWDRFAYCLWEKTRALLDFDIDKSDLKRGIRQLISSIFDDVASLQFGGRFMLCQGDSVRFQFGFKHRKIEELLIGFIDLSLLF